MCWCFEHDTLSRRRLELIFIHKRIPSTFPWWYQMPWTEKNLEVNREPCFHHFAPAARSAFQYTALSTPQIQTTARARMLMAPAPAPSRFWPNYHLPEIAIDPNPVVIAVIGSITPTQPMKFLHAHAAFDRPLLSQVSKSCLICRSLYCTMSCDAIVANRKSWLCELLYATVRRSFIYKWLGFIWCCSNLLHPQNSTN